MRLRIELLLDSGDPPVLVEVEAPRGSPLAQALPAIAEAAGLPLSALNALFHQDQRVPSEAVLGMPPLLDGVRLNGAPVATGTHDVVGGPGIELIASGPVNGGCGAVRLPRGTHLIGRGAQCRVRLEDDTLSRRHALLRVDADQVCLVDLGSTNGTQVDGVPVGPVPVPVTVESTVRLGASALTLGAVPHPTASTTATGAGTLAMTPVHRVPEAVPARTVRLPTRPEVPSPPRASLMAVVLSIGVALLLATLTGNPVFAAFGLLAPVLTVAHQAGERRHVRSERSRRSRAYRAQRRSCQAELAEALRAEQTALQRLLPDAEQVIATGTGRTVRLWERHLDDPYLLVLRVGVGPRTARSGLVSADGSTHHPLLPEAPLDLDLRSGPVGLLGPPPARDSLARALMAQVVTWHSPRAVRVVVVTTADRRHEWAWLDWCNHTAHLQGSQTAPPGTAGPTGTERADPLLAQLPPLVRLRESPSAGRHPARLVVLVDGPIDPDAAGMLETLATDAHEVGMHLVGLADHSGRLPFRCRSTLTVGADGSGVIATVTGQVSFRAEGLSGARCEQLGRALACLRDPSTPESEHALPRQVVLPAALGLRPDGGIDRSAPTTDQADRQSETPRQPGDCDDPEVSRWAAHLRARWRACPPGLEAAIGVGPSGPFHLDLCGMGPHALIAGTTGSGKSELLRALVAALSATYPPECVVFVLVDYKGGAAFADCARLPHTAGLITDLDNALAERALTALHAELRRREATLQTAGVDDITALPAGPDGLPQLPRMVLVIDEFRALADEFPGFLDGLVRLAAQGRSLGLHVVLATQRPAGIVTADVKANLNLRVALRVRDSADSLDVIDADDAARIPADLPGRAYLRCGGGELTAVQTGWTGEVRLTPDTPISARVLGSPARYAGPPDQPPGSDSPRIANRDRTTARHARTGDGPSVRQVAPDGSPSAARSDLAKLVAAAREAARADGRRPATPPWPPPLPLVVDALRMPEPDARGALSPDYHPPVREPDQRANAPCHGSGLPGSMQLAFGVVDDAAQRQHTALSRGTDLARHLAIAGAGGTGRSSALRTLAGLLARAACPATLHLYLLDGGGTLGDLANLPHTCGYADRTDVPLMARLVGHLTEEMAAVPNTHRRNRPHVVLLVDNWESVVEALDGYDRGRSVEGMWHLIRDGESARVSVLLTAGRSVLLAPLASLVTDRLALRLPDPHDLVLAGLADSRQAAGIPGRARELSTGRHAQLAVLGPDPSLVAQREQLRTIADQARQQHPACRPPAHRRVLALPERIGVSELPPCRLAGELPVGIGPLGTTTASLPAAGSLLVVGPAGSGRSSTLTTLARGVHAAGRRLLVLESGPEPPTADGLPSDTPILNSYDVSSLAEACRSRPGLTVFCDDLPGLVDTPAEDVLLDLLAQRHRTGGAVVASVDPHAAHVGFRGLIGALRRAAAGLVLHPTPRDDEIFGVALPVGEVNRPGRGVLVRDGTASVVQVALPY